jgi:uncharacterized protein YcbX
MMVIYEFTGLLYDREWMLQSAGGDVLTQKKVSDGQ